MYNYCLSIKNKTGIIYKSPKYFSKQRRALNVKLHIAPQKLHASNGI